MNRLNNNRKTKRRRLWRNLHSQQKHQRLPRKSTILMMHTKVHLVIVTWHGEIMVSADNSANLEADMKKEVEVVVVEAEVKEAVDEVESIEVESIEVESIMASTKEVLEEAFIEITSKQKVKKAITTLILQAAKDMVIEDNIEEEAHTGAVQEELEEIEEIEVIVVHVVNAEVEVVDLAAPARAIQTNTMPKSSTSLQRSSH